ncbi:hypothetical protein [Microbacterium sp. 1P06AB]|uniref:hypothetical protein n=1 Tax=Microbacterium sp. 1P06AB TaxID=3132289 RepID=UPI0039A41FB6
MTAGSPGRAVLWGVAALVLATIFLAPVIGVGRCVDSSVPDASFCESYTTTYAGFRLDVWPWLIAVVLIVVVTTVVAIRRHRAASA